MPLPPAWDARRDDALYARYDCLNGLTNRVRGVRRCDYAVAHQRSNISLSCANRAPLRGSAVQLLQSPALRICIVD